MMRPDTPHTGRAMRQDAAALAGAAPSHASLSRPSAPAAIARGHRTYIDNPNLIRTVAHKPPVARGHRAFIGKVEWR
jgi:hypothetical protein